MNEKIEALVDACWVPDTYAVIGRVGMQLSQTNVRAAIIAAYCIGQESMRDRCAKGCAVKANEVEDRLNRGKGTWPQEDYIRDETWANWHGERYAFSDAERAIRALPVEE